MAKTEITRGRKFGDWQISKFLGEGGNGAVWLASNASAEIVAIKLLTKTGNTRGEKVYARFKNEVRILIENSDIDGLLPIIDYDLPTEIGEGMPWYVMPVAEPLDDHIVGRGFEVAIQSVLEIGKVLNKLHERNISHRDIKPANILFYENKYYLSDFGLVDYANKQDLTGTGERIGAKWTIAPEMERDSQNADGKPADVYSLAKTLWILLTGKKYGFEGQYDPDSTNGLNRLNLTLPGSNGIFFTNAPRLYLKRLDDLLRDSTNDDPLQRPRMYDFVERLEFWIQVYKDFRKRNPLQWQDIQKRLFPMALPQRVIWVDIKDIVEVLNIVSSYEFLNHMILPSEGGTDLREASLGRESGTLELIVSERRAYVVRPKRLIFDSFGFDKEWNYFRLETEVLEPTGLSYPGHSREELVELGPLHYISRSDWENDMNQGMNYSKDVRFVTRYFRGDFLILQKTSHYNRSPHTYDAKFNRMNSDEFRQYFAEIVQLVRQIHDDENLISAALNKGISLDDLVADVLRDLFREEYLNEKGIGIEWRK